MPVWHKWKVKDGRRNECMQVARNTILVHESAGVGISRVVSQDYPYEGGSCTSESEAVMERQPGRLSNASVHAAIGMLLMVVLDFAFGGKSGEA